MDVVKKNKMDTNYHPDKSLASNKSWSYFSAVTILPPKYLPFNDEQALSTSVIKKEKKEIVK